MRFQSDREKREVLEKVRKGIPLLKWKKTYFGFVASYELLSFEIYTRASYPTRSEIILYLDGYFAKDRQDRFILKRIINIEDIATWIIRSDELLFYILNGKVSVESGNRPKFDKPKDLYAYEDRKDIYDDLLKTFRSKR